MSRVIEFVKRFVKREPLLVRTAAGMLAAYAVQLLDLDPAAKTWITGAIVAAVAAWVRSKVTPADGP